jgi:hypothetical protein
MDPININTQNSTGMMNGMPPVPKPEKKVGPMIGAIIIILALIAAALYFFGQKVNTNSPANNVLPDPTTAAIATPANTDSMQAAAAKSDDVTSIETDLSSQLKDIDYSF